MLHGTVIFFPIVTVVETVASSELELIIRIVIVSPSTKPLTEVPPQTQFLAIAVQFVQVAVSGWLNPVNVTTSEVIIVPSPTSF